MTRQRTIKAPPFPPLSVDDDRWEAWIPPPPDWADLRRTWGPFAKIWKAEPTRFLRVRAVGHGAEPTREQRAAYAHLLANGPAIRRAVLAALAADYTEKRTLWVSDAEELDDDEQLQDLEEWMPALAGAHDLVDRVELCGIHVHHEQRDGVAYLGIQLWCTWDEEHGAGVMLHGSRVVAVGHADTSFLEWIAKRDAEGRRGAGSA